MSFGLFVPPRLLRAARFGGLNVHPSLLPDLHGAAPIEHAILYGRARTGVTVQTLDETTFDGGRWLLQGPLSGGHGTRRRGLPIPPRCTAAGLYQQLAPIGAELLVEVLRRGLYLPGAAVDVLESPETKPMPAPKLTKADRQVPWRPPPATASATATATATATAVAVAGPISAHDIDRRARALGPLWTHMASRKTGAAANKRAILSDICLVGECPEALQDVLLQQQQQQQQLLSVRTVTFVQEGPTSTETDGRSVTLPFVVDGDSIVLPVGAAPPETEEYLRIGTITVEGDKAKPAARAIEAFASRDTPSDHVSWDVALRAR